MDKKQLQSQARVLRNKRFGNRLNLNPPTVRAGVVKFNKPVERKNAGVNLQPPTAAQVARLRAEKFAEQRRQLMALKDRKNPTQSENKIQAFELTAGDQTENAKSGNKRKTKTKKGCSSCRRKSK